MDFWHIPLQLWYRYWIRGSITMWVKHTSFEGTHLAPSYQVSTVQLTLHFWDTIETPVSKGDSLQLKNYHSSSWPSALAGIGKHLFQLTLDAYTIRFMLTNIQLRLQLINTQVDIWYNTHSYPPSVKAYTNILKWHLSSIQHENIVLQKKNTSCK